MPENPAPLAAKAFAVVILVCLALVAAAATARLVVWIAP